MKNKVILGIDPGTTVMGYGLIEEQGSEVKVLALGILELHKYSDHYQKLKKIFERTLGLIDEYKPQDLAIEAPFFGKNVQSLLKLGRAQGVVMAAALYRSLPVFEYEPRLIKQSITGNGNASKEQVAGFLKNLLKLNELPKKLDATDGLAVALCHHFRSNSPITSTKGYKGWGDFISKNPDRVK